MTRANCTEDVRRLDGRRTGSAVGQSEHESAVVEAEIRRLVHALRPYGVLRRDALARAANVDRWHEAGFEQALRLALAEREIEELPFGFYRLPRSESSGTKSVGTHDPAA
jgi:hypothetical protein